MAAPVTRPAATSAGVKGRRMAFSFLAWNNMSAGFAGVAGVPVTAVPWGNHFALFATDAGDVVSCAGGDPQNGLATRSWRTATPLSAARP